METRRILQIVLGLIVLAILALAAITISTFAGSGEVQVVKEIVYDTQTPIETVNPRQNQGNLAVELVKTIQVQPPTSAEDAETKRGTQKRADSQGEPDLTTIGALLEQEDFVKRHLKLSRYAPQGWTVEWWGETKYGQWFYLVRYAFKDANITVGPAWLVDLKGAKAYPKNVLARLVMDPATDPTKDEYYDKHQQVVSALVSHRFDSGLSLGGALLIHFQNREETSEKDSILGWTIEHDRGPLFRAYFQWIEAGDPTYAEFEFDYQKKALKASNLQAADVMRIGEDFSKTERANIMPESYDPEAKPQKRWLGPSRKACASRKQRARCNTMAKMFEEREIIESLEWLLTAQAGSVEAFKLCKEDRKCKWSADEAEQAKDAYQISYIYDLEEKPEQRVSWQVSAKGDEIKPLDRISKAAWLAIHPRER